MTCYTIGDRVLESLRSQPLKTQELIAAITKLSIDGEPPSRGGVTVALRKLRNTGQVVRIQYGWHGLPGWNSSIRNTARIIL